MISVTALLAMHVWMIRRGWPLDFPGEVRLDLRHFAQPRQRMLSPDARFHSSTWYSASDITVLHEPS